MKTLKLFRKCIVLGAFFLSGIMLKAQIVVEVTNIQSVEGNIFYGLYDDPEVYLELDKQFRVDAIPVKSLNMVFIIDEIPAGIYALSLFHDLNGDDVMQKNFFGYPKEPFGFSQNYRPTFRAPKFSESQFEYDGHYIKIVIELNDQ